MDERSLGLGDGNEAVLASDVLTFSKASGVIHKLHWQIFGLFYPPTPLVDSFTQ